MSHNHHRPALFGSLLALAFCDVAPSQAASQLDAITGIDWVDTDGGIGRKRQLEDYQGRFVVLWLVSEKTATGPIGVRRSLLERARQTVADNIAPLLVYSTRAGSLATVRAALAEDMFKFPCLSGGIDVSQGVVRQSLGALDGDLAVVIAPSGKILGCVNPEVIHDTVQRIRREQSAWVQSLTETLPASLAEHDGWVVVGGSSKPDFIATRLRPILPSIKWVEDVDGRARKAFSRRFDGNGTFDIAIHPNSGIAVAFTSQEQLDRILYLNTCCPAARALITAVGSGNYGIVGKNNRKLPSMVTDVAIPALLAMDADTSKLGKPHSPSSAIIDLEALSVDRGSLAIWLFESWQKDKLFPTENMLWGIETDPNKAAKLPRYRQVWREYCERR